MKEIIIKAMRFLNFKGLRELTITFPGKYTDISGDNGLGKSSIFDGFTWVLFGKDRLNREQFGIKTLDRDNNPIPRIPHEVSIDLLVNGEPVNLTRRYEEVWTRKKGEQEEKFDGHEQTRLYNDVPCSKDEWKAKIADLCPENVFKMITNPLYFSSQKKEVQREMLIRMAGGVSDADVAAGNTDFTSLLGALTGKTMAEYKAEIAASKKRIKAEIKDTKGAIKENKRKVFQPEDWDALEAERDSLTEKRASVLAQIGDASKIVTEQNKARAELSNKLNEINSAIREREFTISEEVKKDYRQRTADRQALLDSRTALLRRVSSWQSERDTEQANVTRCENYRKELISQYTQLLEESKRLAAQYANPEVSFSDSDFRCPTCGHQYDIDRIDEIQENALRQARKRISNEQHTNALAIEENKRLGKSNNEKKQRHLSAIADLDKKIEEGKEQIKAIEANPLFESAGVEPDAAPYILADSQLIELRQQAEALKSQLSKQPEHIETAPLQKEAEMISDQIMDIAVRLSKRQEQADHKARLEELETELRNANNELSRLEGIEFTIAAFTKARIEKVENKINSLFSLVRFKMYDHQVNGGEAETCEAVVDGVPFSDLNDAGKLNAGLDIINAICRFEGFRAPIFMDNSEGINRPIPTDSQRIRLIVTKEPELTIKASDTTPSLF